MRPTTVRHARAALFLFTVFVLLTGCSKPEEVPPPAPEVPAPRLEPVSKPPSDSSPSAETPKTDLDGTERD